MPVDPTAPDPLATPRASYSGTVEAFLSRRDDDLLGALTRRSSFAVDTAQRDAWIEQIGILRTALPRHRNGSWLALEYSIPRIGRRLDALLLIQGVLIVVEFKVGAATFNRSAVDQVWDYALDLKNFHSTSHDAPIVPILVATQANFGNANAGLDVDRDQVYRPLRIPPADLSNAIARVVQLGTGGSLDAASWLLGRYAPTPTIIEAATALYGGHRVDEISRSDASAINLAQTSDTISKVASEAKTNGRKCICFVTGVPGAGKTLVGLNVATQHLDRSSDLYSVFLSGNGPLVAVLREALARDQVRRAGETGTSMRLGQARSEVKAFIQNVHHFRDECLIDVHRAPIEHVVLFDEAQRAWDRRRTMDFMRRKRGIADFAVSEPEFLISCMDRHQDWAVVICLVGGGQEINTGEAGIREWVEAMLRSFPDWHIYLSSHLHDSEYAAGDILRLLSKRKNVHEEESLHLGVSMRSFRAETLSLLVKCLLDLDWREARLLYSEISPRYPVVLTRNLERAKSWLRSKARGSERFGLMVSSQAQRLKPYAIDVRSPVDPIHWFLHPREDVRSSYYLEDVATEFHVQGLELDWTCVVWDGDFRHTDSGWEHWSFKGDRWERVRAQERQAYQKNAYRVLLTRARQGMVIVVPQGDRDDPTRSPEFYDGTFEYLRGLGLNELEG